MHRNNGKKYIKKEKKWNVIITLLTIVIVMVVIAVIELLPSRVPELGYSDMNGVGRSFLYPFVFFDAKNNLYLMQEDQSVTVIDDNVSAPLHDSANGKLYYLKSNVLYEYSLKSNSRIILNENVAGYSLMGNRRAIVCKNLSNEILLYMFKGNQTKLLSETASVSSQTMYVVSSEGVLFADGNRLIYSDYTGQTHTIAENLNISKKFYISEDGSKICYYENDVMYIASTDGEIIQKIVNGQPVLFQKAPILIMPSTGEQNSNGGIPFRYFLSDISLVYHPENNNSSEYTAGSLQYFHGDELKEVATNIYKVIYYSQEDDFLLYSVRNGDRMDIYMTSKGKKPVRQINCGINDKFVFDDRTNYLYYQDEDKTLYRYDIYDVKLKVIKIAENTGNIYDYYNKPFIAYDDAQRNETYLLLKNKIEKIDSNMEKRLYGRNNEIYLLCRQNIDGLITLDYVAEDKLTRISNNIGTNLFFDRDMEYILYNENEKLYVWHNGQISCVGEYQNIKAVDIIK